MVESDIHGGKASLVRGWLTMARIPFHAVGIMPFILGTVLVWKIWRESELFLKLRDRENTLKGQCGECSYRGICGGCRGRAMACSGDYLSEDPSCFIHPPEGSSLAADPPGILRARAT